MRFNVIRRLVTYVTVLVLLLTACGANKIEDAASGSTPQPGHATTESSQSESSTPANQFVIDGYTYSISPSKVLREVDNMPPGYVLPHPSFQISLVDPVDRGAKLFADFNGHFRVAYRRAMLDDVLDYDGASYDTSDCQDVQVLPGFCTFDLLVESGSNIVQRNIYESILTDEYGNNIQDPYAWLTVNKSIFIQFPGDHLRFVVRDGYTPSDFALLYLDLPDGQQQTVDTLMIIQG
jgi:hypothetical protein